MDTNFLLAILVWFIGNGSIPILVPLIVDILKRIPGLVKDGTSGTWASAINLVGLVGFSILFFALPGTSFASVDAVLVNILRIVTIVLGFAAELFVGPAVHDAGKEAKLPLQVQTLLVFYQ